MKNFAFNVNDARLRLRACKNTPAESNLEERPVGTLWTEPLHERAAARLRDMIVMGTLAPGAPISEKELCEQFGISRTPLREALKILGSEGLIELLPRRGAVVTPIVTEELRQKFEVVRLLEDFAVKLVCERASDAQLAELQAVHRKLLESAKADADLTQINDQFHKALMKASGNESLRAAHAPLWQHLRRARRIVLGYQNVSSGDYLLSHERLMKAIGKRDSAGAVREMEVRWAAAERKMASLLDPEGASMPARHTGRGRTQ
jgi:DNA-binding GntR family transcriptional regulator